MTNEKTKTLKMTVSADFLTTVIRVGGEFTALDIAERCLPGMTLTQFRQVRDGKAAIVDVNGGVEVRSL